MTILRDFSSTSSCSSQIMDKKSIRAFLRMYYEILSDSKRAGTLSYVAQQIIDHSTLPFTDAHPDGQLSFNGMSLLRYIADSSRLIWGDDTNKLFDSIADETYLTQCCLALHRRDRTPILSVGLEDCTVKYSKSDGLSTIPDNGTGNVMLRPVYNLVIFGSVIIAGQLFDTNIGTLSVSNTLCTWYGDSTISVPVIGNNVFIALSYTNNELWITVMSEEVHDLIIPYSGIIHYVNMTHSSFSKCVISDTIDTFLLTASLHSNPAAYLEAMP